MAVKQAGAAAAEYEAVRDTYVALAAKAAATVNELLLVEGVNFQSVSHRAKDVGSFRRKLERKVYASPLTDVTDLAGIRIVCYVEGDVERVCNVVQAAFTIDDEHSDDKTRGLGTDKVGYRSVHFVARFTDQRLELPEYARFRGLCFEVQVRTILQHAWAEIEHDRNYKFAGVLPDGLKRRFSLVAGVLEMADREFDAISNEIDAYAATVAQQTAAGDLDIPLTTSALHQYLLKTFQSQVAAGLRPDFGGGQSDIVIQELRDFGVHTLRDLDSLVTEELKGDHSDLVTNETFVGLLRDIMILHDAERYFAEAWDEQWQGIHASHVRRLEESGVPMTDIANRYDILIQDDLV